MRITADTNVLLRAFLDDEAAQGRLAENALAQAEIVAVSLHALCEFAWVLSHRYKTPRQRIVAAIQALVDTQNVVLNRPAVEAGLAMLAAGGDFADGVIAYEGRWLGGDVFISFDRRAVELLRAQGQPAQLIQ